MDDWLATMPDLRLEMDELAEAGDQVLFIGRIQGAGAGSGAGAGVTLCTLSTFDGERAVRVEEFLDPATARAEFEHRTAAPE